MGFDKRWWEELAKRQEVGKANYDVPDGLGIGIRESRDLHGQLVITLGPGVQIVIGKYAMPKPDGSEYYVAHWAGGGGWNPTTTYHEHLVMAVAKAVEIAEDYDKSYPTK